MPVSATAKIPGEEGKAESVVKFFGGNFMEEQKALIQLKAQEGGPELAKAYGKRGGPPEDKKSAEVFFKVETQPAISEIPASLRRHQCSVRVNEAVLQRHCGYRGLMPSAPRLSV